MANFGQLILTNSGIQAQYLAQGGSPLKFTRIGMGSGRYSGNIPALTKLVTEKVSVDISKGYMQNDTYTIEGFFSNEALQTGFEWREIGVFVEDQTGNEVLYCYANAGDSYDYIPATADERYSKYIRVATVIGNASNVSIAENEGILYVDTVTFNTLASEVESIHPSKGAFGGAIIFKDSAELPFVGMKVHGKSEQASEPSPDNPQEIVSVGDGKSVVIRVYGKNLWDNANITIGNKNCFSLTETGVSFARGSVTGGTYVCYKIPLRKGQTVTFSAKGSAYRPSVVLYEEKIYDAQLKSGVGELTYTAQADYPSATFALVINSTEGDCVFSDIQVECNDTATEFELYKSAQTLALSVPNGLAGIPVSSGGNYTDENGQEWICDEVDLERGVRINRCGTKTLVGTENWYFYNAVEAQGISFYVGLDNAVRGLSVSLCDSFRNVEYSWDAKHKETFGIYSDHPDGKYKYFRAPNDSVTTLDEWKTWLASNHVKVVYVLSKPVETALTDEEITAYMALHSNNPTTTIFNDAGVRMYAEAITRSHEAALSTVLKLAKSVYTYGETNLTAGSSELADGTFYFVYE